MDSLLTPLGLIISLNHCRGTLWLAVKVAVVVVLGSGDAILVMIVVRGSGSSSSSSSSKSSSIIGEKHIATLQSLQEQKAVRASVVPHPAQYNNVK